MRLRATRLSAISNAVRGGFRGPLDGLSAATKAALVHLSSGRRLLKTYPKDGPIVRVRRSTDNAEADIGALKNGWIDVATAASFVGNGDPFVVTGYDQRVTSIEERRNLLTYSEQIDNPVWSKSGSTITANAGNAPDGTTTADKLLENTATSQHYTLQNLAISGVGTYTASVYAKAVERSSLRIWLLNAATADRVQAVYDLSTGTLVSSSAAGGAPFVLVGATIQALADGWYRLSLTGTTTGGAISLQSRILLQNSGGSDSYLGDGTSGLLVWGAQIERSATATTYQRVDAGTEFPKRFVGAVLDSHELTQPTATAQPRLQIVGGVASMVFDGNDHFERPATDWPTNVHTLTGVTVAARVSTPNPSLSAAVWSMRDNSTGFIAFGRNTAGTLYIFHTSDAGVSRSAISTVTLPANQSVTLLAEWNFVTATARLWMDGVLIATLTGLDIAGGLTARRHWLGATRTTDIAARWTGPISTPVIVGSVLTDDERTLLNNTLGATPS